MFALVVTAFCISVVQREPWRGHLAEGDQWVTAWTLRRLAAWQSEGALAMRFGLVVSPPTAEFSGERRLLMWAMPGQTLILHGIFEALGLDCGIEEVMRVNLAIHLLLVLVLTGLAFALAKEALPNRPRLTTLLSLSAGWFALFLPAIAYWGQNISSQDFTVLPLMTIAVLGRWFRDAVSSRWARLLVDAAVAVSMFLGTISDWPFWLFLLYALAARIVAARIGRPHAGDPWRWTLLCPFVLGMLFLFSTWAWNHQLFTMVSRLAHWGVGAPGGGGIGMAVLAKLAAFVIFFGSHFGEAFSLAGIACLIFAFTRLLRRRHAGMLSPKFRAILFELSVPCLGYTFVLAEHSAYHTTAAIKWVPFVTLTWTIALPLLILGMRPMARKSVGVAYGVLAVLVALPARDHYEQFFPKPELGWDDEGALLREYTEPVDVVVSPVTEIRLVPPQRSVLTDRRVSHVYGPLDVAQSLGGLGLNGMIAVYGPPEFRHAFGAADEPVIERGGRHVVRFPVRNLHVLLESRPDGLFRAELLNVLYGSLRSDAAELRQYAGAAPSLRLPIALHILSRRALFPDRLYWKDDRHYHYRPAVTAESRSSSFEFVVLGEDEYFVDSLGFWKLRDPEKDAPLPAAPAQWGGLIQHLYTEVGPRSQGGEVSSSPWRGYEVLRMPLRNTPAPLAAAIPARTGHDAYLVGWSERSVAVAFAARDPSENDGWVVVVFDEPAVDIRLPGKPFEAWKVKQR